MSCNPNPLEKVIEKHVCAFAKAKGCYVRKLTSPSHRSVPDRLFITPAGTVFFMELKRRGERPTPGQLVEIQKIRKMNVKCFVCDNVEDGKRVIESMCDVLGGY